MPRSDLPFGSEFSPDQIDLAVLLELADEHGADWKNGFENAVRARYFAGHRTSDYNRSKLANNTKLSMRAYGLIGDRDATLTETGRVLHGLRGDEAVLLEAFAREGGRGAKPFLITATDKLAADVITPLVTQLERQVQHELRPLLRKPLRDVRADLESGNRHVRGLALEALAFKLMRFIDLAYVGTRLRGEATGGAEVDLIFESTRLVFSRWQIQCKNTGRVSLDDVAKEVGLTHVLKSNAVVMVSTGRISEDARRYANRIMADSNLCIVMVDGGDLSVIEARPAAIVDVFTREARHAMDLKKLDL